MSQDKKALQEELKALYKELKACCKDESLALAGKDFVDEAKHEMANADALIEKIKNDVAKRKANVQKNKEELVKRKEKAQKEKEQDKKRRKKESSKDDSKKEENSSGKGLSIGGTKSKQVGDKIIMEIPKEEDEEKDDKKDKDDKKKVARTTKAEATTNIDKDLKIDSKGITASIGATLGVVWSESINIPIGGPVSFEVGFELKFTAKTAVSEAIKFEEKALEAEISGSLDFTGKILLNLVLAKAISIGAHPKVTAALKLTGTASVDTTGKHTVKGSIEGGVNVGVDLVLGPTGVLKDTLDAIHPDLTTTFSVTYNLANEEILKFKPVKKVWEDGFFQPSNFDYEPGSAIAGVVDYAKEVKKDIEDVIYAIENGLIAVADLVGEGYDAAVNKTTEAMKGTTDLIEEVTGIDVETEIVESYDSTMKTVDAVSDGLSDWYNEMDLEEFTLEPNRGISKTYDYGGEDIHMHLHCILNDGNKHDIDIVSRLYFKGHLVDTTKRDESGIASYGSYINSYPLYIRKDGDSDAAKVIKGLLERYSKEELSTTKWIIKSTVIFDGSGNRTIQSEHKINVNFP